MALITIAQTKQYLNIEGANNDALLEYLIASAGAEVVNTIRQQIEAQTGVQLEFNGRDTSGYAFTIYNFPVNAVTALEYRSSLSGGWTSCGTYGTDYTLSNGTLFYNRGFIENYSWPNYRVTYNYGYDTVPGPVVQVALEMVACMYKETDAQGTVESRLGVSSVSESASGATFTKSFLDMRPKWQSRLYTYTVMPVA